MIETSCLVQMLESTDPAAWSRTLFAAGRELGFDKVLYAAVGSRHAKLESAFVSSNYSPAWRQQYDKEGLAYVDPTVVHCAASNLPIVWMPNAFQSPAQHALYEEACGHGIRSGVSLPIHGPNGEAGMISFASDIRPDAQFTRAVAQRLPALALLRDYAFGSAQKFVDSGHDEDVPHLTRRELEVLKWVMAGKTSWEISKIVNCSEATVNFHLANVRQKFNVNTRQQAIVKAIALGMLNPEDRHR